MNQGQMVNKICKEAIRLTGFSPQIITFATIMTSDQLKEIKERVEALRGHL